MVRRSTYDRTIQSNNHFTDLKVVLTTMPQNEIHMHCVCFCAVGTTSSGYVKCRRPTKGKLKLEDQKGGAHVSQRKISFRSFPVCGQHLLVEKPKIHRNFPNCHMTFYDLSDGFFSQLQIRSCMLLVPRNLNSK